MRDILFLHIDASNRFIVCRTIAGSMINNSLKTMNLQSWSHMVLPYKAIFVDHNNNTIERIEIYLKKNLENYNQHTNENNKIQSNLNDDVATDNTVNNINMKFESNEIYDNDFKISNKKQSNSIGNEHNYKSPKLIGKENERAERLRLSQLKKKQWAQKYQANKEKNIKQIPPSPQPLILPSSSSSYLNCNSNSTTKTKSSRDSTKKDFVDIYVKYDIICKILGGRKTVLIHPRNATLSKLQTKDVVCFKSGQYNQFVSVKACLKYFNCTAALEVEDFTSIDPKAKSKISCLEWLNQRFGKETAVFAIHFEILEMHLFKKFKT